MKNKVFSLLLLLSLLYPAAKVLANEPDSAYIFAYATEKNRHKNGLHFAWSLNTREWHAIGNEHSFLKSDYGNWSDQKRMILPFLYQDQNGLWQCLWTLNEEDGVFSQTSSVDLIQWKPQSYPSVSREGNCQAIEVNYNTREGYYLISWADTKRDEGVYGVRTKDFKSYSAMESVPELVRTNARSEATINGREQIGTIHKVPWTVIDNLIREKERVEYKAKLHNELMVDDPVRFARLQPFEAEIHIATENRKDISDMLIGIFFEDINYAADGGLYAELVQNRGFEYALSDRNGWDHSWNSYKAWTLRGENAIFTIDTLAPVHPNNKHYAVLKLQQPGAGLVNEGFDGIPLIKGDKYDFSAFVRNPDGKARTLSVRLIGSNGEVYGQTTLKSNSSDWKKYSAVITASETVANARLEIRPQSVGEVALDMISLFPQKTFKGRKNGLRNDLAQTLAEMKPRFVRFPGGCVAHGDGLDNMYNWKNTIGPLESRKPQRNIWNYHQSMGLGYYEYFLFCEDLGAEPLPIIPAGVPCQNSSVGGHGQQCGVPMEDMPAYIQDVLDLIEWANGDPKKSPWAKLRAEAGHPKPFNLKYIGIGNEDLISDVFEERYVMICNAIKEQYPEMIIVGTAGPFYEGSDYREGWRIATELNLPMIDEHYYNPPGWYIHNQDYYDRYDRNKSQVYLGEYASHVPGRHNNIETALTEALHLINVERNGDIVALTSYAPLLAKEHHTQWNPDLIYFTNTEVKPTVGYHVQKLFGNNAGTQYITNRISVPHQPEDVRKRIACSVVYDEASGDWIVKLANLLPVEVTTKLNWDALPIAGTNIEKTVLSGTPDDRGAKPVVSSVSPESLNELTLPAYSFVVVRGR